MTMVLDSRDPTARGMSYGVVANLPGAPGAPASRRFV